MCLRNTDLGLGMNCSVKIIGPCKPTSTHSITPKSNVRPGLGRSCFGESSFCALAKGPLGMWGCLHPVASATAVPKDVFPLTTPGTQTRAKQPDCDGIRPNLHHHQHRADFEAWHTSQRPSSVEQQCFFSVSRKTFKDVFLILD